MAATPPMPPGSKSYPLNGSSNSSSSSNHNSPAEGNTKGRSSSNNISEAINQHFLKKREAPATRQRSRCGSYEQLELLDHPQPAAGAAPAEAEAEAGRKPSTNCNCTNISIMHLFHEMKQEFPTIPDAIVTQCVSENCHQRENCIHMLKKELALHPIPVQSYPAKVLQQQQQRQAKPPTPLKPLRVAPTQPPEPSLNGNGNGNGNGDASPSPTHSPSPQPRPRPTTLNLQRQLNAQLQQKIQQRQQRQQRDQQPPQLTPTSLNKPLRRAPGLPPPPGPPLAPKPSFSNDSSCLTSPMSSSESEFSLNAVSLSSPTSATRAAAAAATAPATTPQQASPVRHRSVINLQPELPYARDFLSNSSALSPALTPPTLPGSPGSASAVSPGRKSFTSLNLTLRQPTGGAQSAIDITAGPAPSGQGSGITYSSVSFDARRGTHKNFQLTVTDEGSVFSAGCIRPQAPYAACEPQQQTAVPPARQPPPAAAAAASLLSTDGLSPDCDMPEVFPYPTQAQNHVVASNYITNHAADSSSGNNNNNGSSSNDSSPVSMPLYAGVLEECDPEARAATIERQKQRRDKLANVLRNNKKRLLVLEQEINILTEPVPVGESERLDRDIKQLTEDCQRLLNLINDPQANGSGPAPNSMNRQHSAPANNNQQQQQLQQQQPQPFPRQRQAGRSQAPPGSLRLHSVPAQPTSQPGPDFVQHHSSAPTSACLTPQQQQQLQLQQEPPPTYAQYYQFQQYLQQQRQQQLQQFQLQQQQVHQPQQQQHQQQQQMPVQRSATDEEEYLSDSDVDEDEEPLDMWACNMCTFRNHPQLNICEACENVRIQPGMIRIVPSGGGPGAAEGAAGPAAANLEQQPQQPYALHT